MPTPAPHAILLIEDSPTQAAELAWILEDGGGHELTVAGDAERGLVKVGKKNFDLIISDLRLPGADGFEFCRQIKGDPRYAHTPVLLMTTEAEPLNVLRGLEAGADGFLTKGREPAEILARVDRLLAAGPRAPASGQTRSVVFNGQSFVLASDSGQIEDVLLSAFQDVVNLRGERDEVVATLNGVLDTVPVGIVVLDAAGSPRLVNRAARRLLGAAASADVADWPETGGMHLPDGTPAVLADLPPAMTLADGDSRFEVELRCGGPDGTPTLVSSTAFRGEGGEISKVISAFTIITDRKAAEEKLARAAYYDALTNLPNRRLFVERLGRALLSNGRRPDLFAVLFLDLDRFKVVNDSLGHQAGDLLLTQVARRLEHCARVGDTVARVGGDEFILLLPHLTIPADAIRVAERIREAIATPFDLDGHEASIGTSIGIALSSTGFEGPDEMVRDADTAMYQAKRRGKGRYTIFDPSMHAKAVERFQLEGELRKAVELEELTLDYQPLVSLVDGRVLGFEALARWNHPTRGVVPPGDFIRLAEETGLIIPMGRWILRRVCEQVRLWQFGAHARDIVVHVNTSMKQVADPGFVETVSSALLAAGVSPGCLRLEITESLSTGSGTERVASVLNQLQALGVAAVLDDFGVSPSTLSFLSRLPVTGLKIDRTFIAKLDDDSPLDRTLQVILNLGTAQHLTVTAEGIETEAQLRGLQRSGCRCGQGYLLSRPLGADEAAGLLGRVVPGWAWSAES